MDGQKNNPLANPQEPSSGPGPSDSVPPESTPSAPPPDPSLAGAAFQPKPKKNRKKLVLLLLLLILLAAGAFAAWKLSDNLNEQTGQQVSKDIGNLRVGLTDSEIGDDLYPKMKLTSYSFMINAQIFEGLVRYEDRSKIAPLLATDWSNPDAETWVFNLKPGVKFHNGSTMDARDVKYSIEKIKKENSDIGPIFANTIKTVEVVNEGTVKIVTDGPDPVLLNRLTFLHIIDDQAPKNAEPSLAGTGPFQVKAGTKYTDKELHLVASDSYHGDKSHVGSVDFNVEADEAALAEAFSAGKYDIAGSFSDASAEKLTTGFEFLSREPEVAFIGMNTLKQGPLKKKEVRQAVRHAVDVQALTDALGYKADPKSQLIPEEIPGHNPSITPYPHDPKKAKDLLAKAGYPDGITLTFHHAASNPKALENELTRQFKEAGINLKFEYRDADFDDFITDIDEGKIEIYLVSYVSDILDGVDILSSVPVNPNVYQDAKFRELVDQAQTTLDAPERLRLLQEASKIVDDDVVVAPLYGRARIWKLSQDFDIKQDLPSADLSVYLSRVKLK